MFSQQTIWAMNNPDGRDDQLHCESCDYPMIGFYEYDGHKVCFECKFNREPEFSEPEE